LGLRLVATSGTIQAIDPSEDSLLPPRPPTMLLLAFVATVACRTDDPGASGRIVPDTSLPAPHTGTTPIPVVLSAAARAHGLDLSVDRVPSSSRLVCEAPDVDGERHEAVDPFATNGRFVLLGLLADTEYHCELLQPGTAHATADADIAATAPSQRTPVLAVSTPWSIAEHVPERRSGAYTLFNLADGDSNVEPHQLLLVDPEGRVRWVHLIADEFPDCDVRYQHDGTILFGGGQGVTPTILSLEGELLWQGPEHDFAQRYHHHAERLDDGTVLAMRHTSEAPPTGQGQPGQTWVGFRIERIAPDGMISWSWTSQRAVDDGVLPIPNPNATDPWHANSVTVLDDGITYVNLRQKSWMLAIAPDGEVLWRLGDGGDFELFDADGTPLGGEHWFHGAHDPELHPQADGTLRILYHDNGYARGVQPAYSQLLELVVDVEARTATRTWTWTEAGWYEPIWGDADELPDGSVLATRGHCGSCPPPSVSEIVEVDRATGEVDWRLRFDAGQWGIYRSQRIDGCAVFHHASYCPEENR